MDVGVCWGILLGEEYFWWFGEWGFWWDEFELGYFFVGRFLVDCFEDDEIVVIEGDLLEYGGDVVFCSLDFNGVFVGLEELDVFEGYVFCESVGC